MKLRIAVITGAVALIAGSAHAGQGACWFGVQGGAAIPMGDFGDAAKLGFQGGANGIYMVTKAVGIGADVAYHFWNAKDVVNTGFQSKDNTAGAANSQAEAKFSGLQLTARGVYMIPTGNEKVTPFLQAGAGMYSLGTKLDNAQKLSDPDSESKFGFNVGAGVNFEVSPMYAVGIQGAFHSIQTEVSSTNLVTLGASVNFGVGGK